jgi:hypothetical protein
VPGYRAPEETTVPYTRLAAALMRPVVDAQRGGRLRAVERDAEPSTELERAVAPVHDVLLPDADTTTTVSALEAWAALIGVISLELFGHFRNAVLHPELLFEAVMRNAARVLGLP